VVNAVSLLLTQMYIFMPIPNMLIYIAGAKLVTLSCLVPPDLTQ